MPTYCNYNCTDLPSHEQVSCGEFKKGGINAIAVVDCDHTITDWSDATQWQNNIDAGTIKLIGPVRAEIPAPSPVEGVNPNSCGADTILDDFDRTITWQDYNVNDTNIAFYNALNRRNAFVVAYHGCAETPEITVIESEVNFVAMRTVPQTRKEKQMFTATGKWTAFDEAPIYDAPAGIFNF